MARTEVDKPRAGGDDRWRRAAPSVPSSGASTGTQRRRSRGPGSRTGASARTPSLDVSGAEWLAVIAHDLRQPVTALGLLIALLRRRNPNPTPAFLKTADEADAAVARMDRLIGDLREVSGPTGTRVAVDRRPTDLGVLVRACLERYGGRLGGRTIDLEVAKGLPKVELDPRRIEKVLATLISDSAKHAEAGAPIRTLVDRCESGVRVTVLGQRGAVDPDEVSHLSAPSSRPDERLNQANPTIGLGLYICKGLVEAHGGHIDVASQDGQTSVSFVLPT